MRVCLYARVACPDQPALDRQVKKLKAFAGEHDIDVVDAAAEFGSGIRLYFEFARRMQDCGVKIFELDRLQRLL